MECINSTTIETSLNNITEVRLILYKYIYSDFNNIKKLMNMIQNKFELFNINYIKNSNSIRIKIKKTNMKKALNYECTPKYYYGILNDIFYMYFNSYINYLNEILDDSYLKSYVIKFLTNINKLHLLYNITIVLDNIIIIHL